MLAVAPHHGTPLLPLPYIARDTITLSESIGAPLIKQSNNKHHVRGQQRPLQPCNHRLHLSESEGEIIASIPTHTLRNFAIASATSCHAGLPRLLL